MIERKNARAVNEKKYQYKINRYHDFSITFIFFSLYSPSGTNVFEIPSVIYISLSSVTKIASNPPYFFQYSAAPSSPFTNNAVDSASHSLPLSPIIVTEINPCFAGCPVAGFKICQYISPLSPLKISHIHLKLPLPYFLSVIFPYNCLYYLDF